MSSILDGNDLLIPSLPGWGAAGVRANAVTMDAANEGLHSVGNVSIPGGGSKTISSSGGSIFWFSGSSWTLSKATTNLRIGIQDASLTAAPVRGDGTFDVYADFSSSSGLAANTYYESAMTTGTKTISHGDIVSIAHILTARGSGDSITIAATSGTIFTAQDLQYPVISTYTGAWGRSPVAQAHAGIIFDDGTFGFISGGFVPKNISTVAYNSGSTPDEIGNLITPFRSMWVRGALAQLNLSATTSPQPTFEFCLYENPLGSSPTLLEAKTVTVDALQRSTTKPIYVPFTKDYCLVEGLSYAITVRPTTATSVTLSYWSVNSTGQLEQSFPGASCYAVSRTDNSGAFSEYSPSDTANCVRACVHLRISGFHANDRVIGSF